MWKDNQNKIKFNFKYPNNNNNNNNKNKLNNKNNQSEEQVPLNQIQLLHLLMMHYEVVNKEQMVHLQI
jgi:hypothetical protein